jgi:hypothetical protein
MENVAVEKLKTVLSKKSTQKVSDQYKKYDLRDNPPAKFLEQLHQLEKKKKPAKQTHQPGSEAVMDPKPEAVRADYKGSGKLQGKVALITGGDSGIGRAVAVAFAKEGCDVIIAYLEEHQDAEETKKMVIAEQRQCLGMAGDVSDSQFCEQLVQQAMKHFGKIDILVNNAAEQHPQEDLQKISDQQLQRTFATNIFSYFYLTRAALPYLKSGAVIINSTSVTAYRGSKHLIDYAASKGAIVAFTRSLALNLVQKGIRVNGVAPGPVWTPLIPASFDEEHIKHFGEKVPMQRAGQPAEIAASYVFLASADSTYMTGQVLHPNGGEIVNA